MLFPKNTLGQESTAPHWTPFNKSIINADWRTATNVAAKAWVTRHLACKVVRETTVYNMKTHHEQSRCRNSQQVLMQVPHSIL